MNTAFPPHSSHEPLPLGATRPEEAESNTPWPGRRTRKPRISLVRWIQTNTFAPNWLPEQLQHPLIGYLVAALAQLAAVSLTLLVISAFPSLMFRGVLATLGVVLIALGWGAGPSLLATLVSALLFYVVAVPPYFSWKVADLATDVSFIIYLFVGISISLLSGRSEQACRKAEEAARLLAQAEAGSRFDAHRLRTVLEVLPSPVVITNPAGQLLAMNQATKTLWGNDIAPGTDLTQRSWYNQVSAWRAGTDLALLPEEWPLLRTLKSGQAVLDEEIEIEAQDGQHKFILNSAAPIHDESGAMAGAVASAVDVSGLRRLEHEAAAHTQELEAIFEAITDGITVLDAKGGLVRTNQAFRAMSGVDRHPESRSLPMDQRLGALAMRDEQGQPLGVEMWPATRMLRGETLTGVDVFMNHTDGREAVVNLGGAPIRDRFGQVSGCVGVFRDMTDRRHLEQRTRETLGALVAMAEAMAQVRLATSSMGESGQAPSRYDTDAALPLVARRLAQLTRSVLGCRRVSIVQLDSATGRLVPVTEVGLDPELEQQWWASWSSAQCLEERVGATIAAALRAGKPAILDPKHLPERLWYTLFQAQTGRLVPMQLGEELVGVLMVDYCEPDHDYSSEQDNMLTGTLARLGALVLERDRLLHCWAEARANELALGETKARMDTFLGIASHELRTPLTSLKLSLQLSERRLSKLIRGKYGTGAELNAALEPLNHTEYQMKRLELLVNDLVDVSRIQAGKLELRQDHAELVAIVHEAVREQRQAAPDRRIRLRCPADLSVPVYADAGRVEQVVTNYLTNALKYSPPDCQVEVGVEMEQEKVRVWVSDQGPGLPLEEQEQIWERFYRAKGIEVQSGTGVGLGLGLYICRMIIERHHGQVGLQSIPGKGSTFWFTLPLSGLADGDL